ncbi:MAG: hypothetical protein OXI41_11385 [Chloroflexota bacterium]|nr:hypothetical protein [Chloroflexota bacterium]MDE2894642.1 hypothetical protein [Chloroflexota bacterium]
MKSDAAEAWGYALLLTRRVLTTALAGATEEQLHRPTPIGSLADCAAEACSAEADLIWPEDLPPARLEPPQTPVQILYALVRHRAVTEEVLMQASDETMQQAWWTRGKRLAPDPEQTLTESLQQLAVQEFASAVKATMIRTQIDAEWSPQLDLQERAQSAIAAAR